MSESAHSILGASSYYRWKACPGSVRLCKEAPPSPPSAAAAEGTRAHEVAESVLKGGRFPEGIPEEMIEAVKLYHETVAMDYTRPSDISPGDALMVEHKFDLKSVWPGMFGTADCVSWHEKLKLLRVYDFKYGKGHVVEVDANPQLMYYGLGALETLPFKPASVELAVVQPRARHKKGPVRRWRTDVFDYLEFRADLREDARKTEDPNAPLVEGRHCFFCPARPTCPVHHDKAIAKAQAEFSVVSDDVTVVSEEVDIFS